ncbi:BTD Biotinidase, partial [Amia calva]|nr:BTD Biotinidase [Amia calva]
MQLSVLIKIAALWQCSFGLSQASEGAHYIAAVYEHNIIFNPDPKVPRSRQAALDHMKENLDIYEEQVAAAAKQGAQIIVFPEDGLHGFNYTRESIVSYSETIPDPASMSWSPCLQPERFNGTEVLHRLSCMAHKHAVYLVANMPDRQECDGTDPHCPPDGRYQFNTDVVFSDDGTIVARYHKQNLYFESEFNTPRECEYVTFDTPFAGRFGLFTCFDILFHEPVITLLEKYQVKQMIFPTAWFNEAPLLSAHQFQKAFATGSGINLLAANLHHPPLRMTGSGIFTPSHSVYHFDMETDKGRLLVSNVSLPTDSETGSPPTSEVCMKSQDCGKPSASKPVADGAAPGTFHGSMSSDNYTFVPVQGAEGDLTVCDGSLCCRLLYNGSHVPEELYAFGVFNGLHTAARQFYLEVCALVRCPGDTFASCGGEVTAGDQTITTIDFHLEGNFSTRYIYPSILTSGMQLDSPDRVGWEKESYVMSKKHISGGLVTATLYGRHYEKD